MFCSGVTLGASLLAGGYERFSSEYPEFCAKTKSLSNVSPPTSAETLDLGCSSCGTPFHDQVCLEAWCSALLMAPSRNPTWSCGSLSLSLIPAEPEPGFLSSAWWSSRSQGVCASWGIDKPRSVNHAGLFLNRMRRGRTEMGLAAQKGSLCPLFPGPGSGARFLRC